MNNWNFIFKFSWFFPYMVVFLSWWIEFVISRHFYFLHSYFKYVWLIASSNLTLSHEEMNSWIFIPWKCLPSYSLVTVTIFSCYHDWQLTVWEKSFILLIMLSKSLLEQTWMPWKTNPLIRKLTDKELTDLGIDVDTWTPFLTSNITFNQMEIIHHLYR